MIVSSVAARAACRECSLCQSAASMTQSLGALQADEDMADEDMADAAAVAEDSEQHSSESDLTPSGHHQQQQQVGLAYSDDHPYTQLNMCPVTPASAQMPAAAHHTIQNPQGIQCLA